MLMAMTTAFTRLATKAAMPVTLLALTALVPGAPARAAETGAVLPFQPAPSASIAGPTLKDSLTSGGSK